MLYLALMFAFTGCGMIGGLAGNLVGVAVDSAEEEDAAQPDIDSQEVELRIIEAG